MPAARTAHAPPGARGYTLVELMVSMAIGLIILAALVSLFAGNSRERGEIERANQQTENGRYALQIIRDDLRSAGYLATFNPGTVAGPNAQLTTPATLPDACAADVPTLTTAMAVPVQGYDQGASAPGCLVDLRAGTDILVVRRASTCAVGAAGCDPQVPGDIYLQASGCGTETGAGTYFALDSNLASLTLHLKDCVTVAPLYQYRTHIYFIANDDKPGDGIPTLKRAELGVDGLGANAFNIVPLVEGVENLQLEYGLDTTVPTTGTPAVYTADPSRYNGCVPGPCNVVSNWRNTVTVKINVLTRSITPTQGYVDSKTYTLGLNAAGAANVVAPLNDGYKRHAYSSVAMLYNTVARNSP
ncbi:MAG: prepilin-type N-terminal cleavage/methylation domain-containing protein [Gammaproteobacteria bacterium]|nr:MAG: prepilin-type N-terminal cleavage/methylation domain-containing protein [Gammaproteobacteria bacterium]